MNNDNKDIRQETDNKPVIDPLAFWEGVEDIDWRKAFYRRKEEIIMTNTYSNEIRIVIGSCNECNEGALGSRRLDLVDYDEFLNWTVSTRSC